MTTVKDLDLPNFQMFKLVLEKAEEPMKGPETFPFSGQA